MRTPVVLLCLSAAIAAAQTAPPDLEKDRADVDAVLARSVDFEWDVRSLAWFTDQSKLRRIF